MFTGIVQHMVAVKSLRTREHGKTLVLNAGQWPGNATVGESICVNGCCLTVVDIANAELAFDVVQHTLHYTTIGQLSQGDMVNVERAMRADSLVGGHFVQGHVDTTAAVLQVERANGQWRTRVESPISIDHLLHERGSVAIDGVSLTIAATGQGWFEVELIPETLAKTTLAQRLHGARVNVEADSMAKAVSAEVARHMQRLGFSTDSKPKSQ